MAGGDPTASDVNADNNAQGPTSTSDDWRLDVITRLATDSSDGHFKEGARLVVVTASKNRRGDIVSFEQPSAAAMAINIAHRAAVHAMELQPRIAFSEASSFMGPGTSVTTATTPALFDYFEQCMVAATFSFQALEAYSNYIIDRNVKEGGYPYTRRKGEVVNLSAMDLERQASTEEKLGIILPDLLGMASPKKKKVWNKFKLLKDKSDATIHIKSVDQAPRMKRPEDLSRMSLFMGFIGADIIAWPKDAMEVIHYFARRDMVYPWMEHLLDQFGIPREPSD